MGRRKNADLIQEILVAASKKTRKAWKKSKKLYKNKKKLDEEKLLIIRNHLLSEIWKYSKPKRKMILKAWKDIWKQRI